MAAPQIQYETLYGIGLLDDLHNYFPAILYDSGRFQTVQQLLHYIRVQSRNRFDLFTFGERSYLDAQARVNQRNTASVSMTFENWIPAQRGTPISNPVVSGNPVASGNPVQRAPEQEQEDNDGDNEEDEEDDENANNAVNINSRNNTDGANLDRLLMVALMDVLANGSGTSPPRTTVRRFQTSDIGSIANLLTSRDTNWALNIENLLQPVIVRPTAEQISNGSEIVQLESSEVCSICQDLMNTSDTIRRLRVCHHSFHQGCIDRWYERNVHCPICRHDIREVNSVAGESIP
jgi:hypothetical protein